MQHCEISAYVIRMKGEGPSEMLAEDCINSGKKHGIDIIPFDAVWGDEVDPLYKKEKLFPFPKSKEHRNTKGVRGCFLSHYRLWKKCANEDKPLLIFEHDAEIIRPIPLDHFDKQHFDVLNLDAYSRSKENYLEHLETWYGNEIQQHVLWHPLKKGFSLYNHTHIIGLHAYIIRPLGAKRLIKHTKQIGVLPADIAVNGIWCRLYRTQTSFCRLNPKSCKDESKSSKWSYTKTEQ